MYDSPEYNDIDPSDTLINECLEEIWADILLERQELEDFEDDDPFYDAFEEPED